LKGKLMKRLLIIGLLFTATVVNAQEFNIKATTAEADLIWKGLRKLPVEEVEPFMAKMRQQIMEQTQLKSLPTPKKE
jgi:hypothetical protein